MLIRSLPLEVTNVLVTAKYIAETLAQEQRSFLLSVVRYSQYYSSVISYLIDRLNIYTIKNKNKK